MSRNTKRVAFLMRHVHHYREPFYRGIVERLVEEGIELDLIHGQASPGESSKNDSVLPSWTTFRRNRFVDVGGSELIYQPVFRLVADHDLVIVEQASRLLVNYALLARRQLGTGPRIAMIGHGKNVASSPSRVGEAAKRFATSKVDWFFGYTEGTRQRLESFGFDPERITVFQNTLDMRSLRGELDSTTEEEIAEFKSSLGIADKRIVIVLGSLYAEKRTDLLAPIGDLLVAEGHDLAMLVVGTGPSRPKLQSDAATRPWLHLLGDRFGKDKALVLKSSELMLIPGVSGLVILDAFAAGIPLVTAHNENHPPEIDYVVSGKNGIMTEEASASSLAARISSLLLDWSEAARLGANARTSGEELSIDSMIERFSDGVVRAVQQ